MKSVLFVVHKSSIEAWCGREILHPDTLPAQKLLQKINQAEPRYDKVIYFEEYPWEPEWNPRRTPYTWESVAVGLIGCNVSICGVQRNLCVGAVYDRLLNHSVNVKIEESLTIDSAYLK